MRINSYPPMAVRFGKDPQQERAMGKVLSFLRELPEDITDRQLHSRLSMELIGPTFLPIPEHSEYKAMKKVAESGQQHPENLVRLAQRSMEQLDNYYSAPGDDFGDIGDFGPFR